MILSTLTTLWLLPVFPLASVPASEPIPVPSLLQDVTGVDDPLVIRADELVVDLPANRTFTMRGGGVIERVGNRSRLVLKDGAKITLNGERVSAHALAGEGDTVEILDAGTGDVTWHIRVGGPVIVGRPTGTGLVDGQATVRSSGLDWRSDRNVKRKVLGVTTVETDEVVSRQLNLDPGALTVTEVRSGTPAESSGIEVHDIIREVDGVRVVNRDVLRKLIQERKVGERVRLGLLRRGKPIELNVEVGSLDAEQPSLLSSWLTAAGGKNIDSWPLGADGVRDAQVAYDQVRQRLQGNEAALSTLQQALTKSESAREALLGAFGGQLPQDGTSLWGVGSAGDTPTQLTQRSEQLQKLRSLLEQGEQGTQQARDAVDWLRTTMQSDEVHSKYEEVQALSKLLGSGLSTQGTGIEFVPEDGQDRARQLLLLSRAAQGLGQELAQDLSVGLTTDATEIASGVGERMERLEDRMARLEELLLELRDR